MMYLSVIPRGIENCPEEIKMDIQMEGGAGEAFRADANSYLTKVVSESYWIWIWWIWCMAGFIYSTTKIEQNLPNLLSEDI